MFPQRRLKIHNRPLFFLKKIYPYSENKPKAHDVQDKLCHVKQKVIIKTAEIKIMKRCKQRNKDGGNILLYLRTESQGFIKSNSKKKGGWAVVIMQYLSF